MSDTRWDHLRRVTAPALELADPHFLDELSIRIGDEGVVAAVRRRDTPFLFDWLVAGFQFQGVSDEIAYGYQASHPLPSWYDLSAAVEAPRCWKLRSHWHFSDCGFRKSRATCNEARFFAGCPVPTFPMRNGRLAQAAFSFFLFVRDICGGDLVGWLDERLEGVGVRPFPTRPAALREALLGPLRQIHGVSDKVLSLALSGLLLCGDPRRPIWIEAGGAMIAIDTLVHNFLHRTGVLGRFGVEHPYGERCYSDDGCAAVIEGLASRIDARLINPGFPGNFPRFVQHAIWRFCSASHFNICNGNRIDDRRRCDQAYCVAYGDCARIALNKKMPRLTRPGHSSRI